MCTVLEGLLPLDVIYNSYSGPFRVIEDFGHCTITIQFVTTGTIGSFKRYHCYRGRVKDNLYPSVFGVGFPGYGEYSRKHHLKCSDIWMGILSRCYRKDKQHHYKGVTTCKDWHNFQNFARWYYTNYVEGFHIDKDILIKDNKEYSPESCCFVPQEINNVFIKPKKPNHKTGVRRQGDKYCATISHRDKQVHLGTFTTEEAAHLAYSETKKEFIKELAEKYKGMISPNCYEALLLKTR